MTLDHLYQKCNLIKEIKLIGKEVVTEDKLCEVIGFYLYDGHLQLLLLEYDEKLIQEEEEHQACEPILTNRERKRQEMDVEYHCFVSGMEEVLVDDISYRAEESGSTRASLSDYEGTMILARFFEKGWTPRSIGKIEIEDCFLSVVTLEGEFDEIPKIQDNPKIVFKFRDAHKAHIIEQPIRLEVDKDYQEKIYFTVKDTGEQHWIYINSVDVYDMYANAMKNFDHPKLMEQYSQEELNRMKADMEKSILELCPKGKGFLSIEYESDCDQQIDFYLKEWLESEPVRTSSSTGFIVRADKKTGKLGRSLRAALIEQPRELSTKMVEAEIFSIYQTSKISDIVL